MIYSEKIHWLKDGHSAVGRIKPNQIQFIPMQHRSFLIANKTT